MTKAAHWRGLLAWRLALTSILAILGTVPLHGAEGPRRGIADRCSGADCASRPVRGVTVYRGLVLDYEVIDGLAVHGGDMVLGTAEEAAAAVRASETRGGPGLVRRDLYPLENSYLWPDGRVPYVIHEDIEGRDLKWIHAAIEEWNTETVVRWFPRTNEHQYALFLPKSDNCQSELGVGSPTFIWAGGCPRSAVSHEMGHAVGLLHEQQRLDRDNFIELAPVVYSVGQFREWQKGWAKIGRDLHEQWRDRPFDHRSVMKYYAYGRFVRTIPPGILGGGSFGGESTLSIGDIDGIARLYGQPRGTITVSTNPLGLNVIVDGESVTTPAVFDWLTDSVHTLEAPLFVQQQETGWRFVFGRWTDGGGRKHTVKAGSDTTWFEASFIHLDDPLAIVHPSYAGTVAFNPESPDDLYATGFLVEPTPIPTEGTAYQFARWLAEPTLWPQGPGLRIEVSGGGLRPTFEDRHSIGSVRTCGGPGSQ